MTKENDGHTLRWHFGDKYSLPESMEDFYAYWEPHLAEEHCGMWCPEEWMEVVHTALLGLKKANPNFEIHQIKEKFGGLRIYWDDPTGKDMGLGNIVVSWAEGRVHANENKGKKAGHADKIKA